MSVVTDLKNQLKDVEDNRGTYGETNRIGMESGALRDKIKLEGTDTYIDKRDIMEMGKVPSLLGMCIQTAIDNVRYLGDVGGIDEQFLEQILPHCTVQQLKHIEDSTTGMDLSPVTNRLWKNFFKNQFGAKTIDHVTERMRRNNVTFTWKQLYEAKAKDVEAAQEKSFQRIRQLYEKEDARKQKRQVQLCTKVPPTGTKRSFHGGAGASSGAKSSLMKKSREDYRNSHEFKNLTAMRRNVVQRNDSPSSTRKPADSSSKGFGSTSGGVRPPQRRF